MFIGLSGDGLGLVPGEFDIEAFLDERQLPQPLAERKKSGLIFGPFRRLRIHANVERRTGPALSEPMTLGRALTGTSSQNEGCLANSGAILFLWLMLGVVALLLYLLF